MAAQLKTVQRAQKDQGNCAKCKNPLPAGGPYRYYRPGFRSRAKVTLCMKPECTPRRSQLESSRMSTAYESIESAQDSIPDLARIEEIEEAIQQCANEIRDVADEYESSISETPMLEATLRDRVDELEQFADDLESLELDEEPGAPESPSANPADYGADFTAELTEAIEAHEKAYLEWESARDQAVEDAKETALDALANL